MSPRQLVIVVFGVVIWFAAAMFIRLALPRGWLNGGTATVAIFLLSLPVAAVSIEIVHRITQGKAGKLLQTASIISCVGLTLDGLAFVWASNLYTPDKASLVFGGAWLLWTVGMTLAYALVRQGHRRELGLSKPMGTFLGS